MGAQPGVLGAHGPEFNVPKKTLHNTDERWFTKHMKSKTCEQLSCLFVTPFSCVLGSFHTWGVRTLDYKVHLMSVN